MTSQKFAVDQLVLESASILTPAHFESFSRLCKKVVYGPDFQLLLVDCRNQLLQQQLQKLLSEVCQKAGFAENQLSLSADIPDVFELQQRLQQLALSHSLIQLTHAAAWFNAVPDGKRWQEFNLLRENIAQSVNCKLVLWLDETAINQMINQAPDWWAWRSGVYTFSSELAQPETSMSVSMLNHIQRRNLSKTNTAKRISELSHWLEKHDVTEPELAAPLAMELGILYLQSGDLLRALDVFESLCVPQLEEQNDPRSLAVVKGKIADIKQSQGDLDEALNIRLNQELPAYVKHGDLRDVAIVQSKIADIKYLQGKFDDALTISQMHCLPAFEELGDVHSVAVTLGQIATIKMSLGELDEALSIIQSKELPVYEKLGDVHAVAVTYGRIANIKSERGEIDEALTIRLELCLPIYEKLGDSIDVAVSKTKIAELLLLRDSLGDKEKAYEFLQEALTLASRMGIPEVSYIQQVLDSYFPSN